ncbi:Tubulin-tyrosine ligase family protein [Toxoplasma gondii VAND]|uniref:Tubulin-tyrosine ligase family protein n=1 Tax=Toxoplasma gondii VAND TaxID=933077 RepID=A0A086PW98_TOXGO|nr:Tubulin-tyrosine ligase family protein [Toxoplasma gondii VAND]
MFPFPTIGALPQTGSAPFMQSASTGWLQSGVTPTSTDPCGTQALNIGTSCQGLTNLPLHPNLQSRFVAGKAQGTPGVAPTLDTVSSHHSGHSAVGAGTRRPSQIVPPAMPLSAGTWNNATQQRPLTQNFSPTYLVQTHVSQPGGNHGQHAFAKMNREGLQQASAFQTPHVFHGHPPPKLPSPTCRQETCPLGIQEISRERTPQPLVYYVQPQQMAAASLPQEPLQRPRDPTEVERSCTQHAGNPIRHSKDHQTEYRQGRSLSQIATISDLNRCARLRFPSPASQHGRLTLSDTYPTGHLDGQLRGVATGAHTVSGLGGQPVHPSNHAALRQSVPHATASAEQVSPFTLQHNMNLGKSLQSGECSASRFCASTSDGVAFALYGVQKALLQPETRPGFSGNTEYRNPGGNIADNVRPSMYESRPGQAGLHPTNNSFFPGQGTPASSYMPQQMHLYNQQNHRISQVVPPKRTMLVQSHKLQGQAPLVNGHSALSSSYPDKVTHTRLVHSPGYQEPYAAHFVSSTDSKEGDGSTLAHTRVPQSPSSVVSWQTWQLVPQQDVRSWPQAQVEVAGDAFAKHVEGTEQGKSTEKEHVSGHDPAQTLKLTSELTEEQEESKQTAGPYQTDYGESPQQGEENLPQGQSGSCPGVEGWTCVGCSSRPVEVDVHKVLPLEDQIAGNTESETEDAEEYEDEGYPLVSLTSPDAPCIDNTRGSATVLHAESTSPSNAAESRQFHSEETEALSPDHLGQKQSCQWEPDGMSESEGISQGDEEDRDLTTQEEVRMPWADDPCVDVQIPSPGEADTCQSSSAASLSASVPEATSSQPPCPSDGTAAATTKKISANRGSGRGQGRLSGRVKDSEEYSERSHEEESGRKRSEKASRATLACALPWKQVVLNTKMCRAERPLINTIGHRLGWVRQDQVSSKGNIVWLGGSVPDHEHLQFMKPMQLVNRFPGMWDMTKKRMLSRILSLYQQLYPDLFDFSPDTWSLPEDRDAIKRILHNKNQAVFILKPDGGAMGNGVQLVSRYKDIDAMVLRGDGNYIMQRYIHNPYLMNKRKFDFRIYCMVISVNGTPKVYISKLGMARFCTEKYRAPTRRNIDNPFMHLTNYSINKDNTSSFVRSTDLHDDSNSKRMLKDVLEDLSKEGVNITSVWDQIKSITARTVVCLYPWLNLRYRHVYKGKDNEPSRCFQLLGLDILLDNNEKCWLLEVNSNPSLRIDYFDSKYEGIDVQLESAMDRHIKEPVVSEGLGLAYRLLLQNRRRCVSEKEKSSGASTTLSRSSRAPLGASGSGSSLAGRGLSKSTKGLSNSRPSSVPTTVRCDDSHCSTGSGQNVASQFWNASKSATDASVDRRAASTRGREKAPSTGAPDEDGEGTGRLETGKLTSKIPWKAEWRRGEDGAAGSVGKRATSVSASRRLGRRSASTASLRRNRSKVPTDAVTEQRDVRKTREGSISGESGRQVKESGMKEKKRDQKSQEEATDDTHDAVELGMEHAVEKVRAFLEHMSDGSRLVSSRAALHSPARKCHAPESPVGGKHGGDGRSDRESRTTASSSQETTSCMTTTNTRASSRTDAFARHTSEFRSDHRSRSRASIQTSRLRSETPRHRGGRREFCEESVQVETPTQKEGCAEMEQADPTGQAKHQASYACSLSRSESVGSAGSPASPGSSRGDESCLSQSVSSFPIQSSQPITPSPQTPSDGSEKREDHPSASDGEAVEVSVLAGAPLPEAEQLAFELDWLDVAYKEMEKCMDGFNVLGLRFANSAAREKGTGPGSSRDNAGEEGKKKFPPGPYKPFLRKDRMAAKKMQPSVKASYTKLHKDILRPLSGEHAKPQHCWIDLASSVNALVAETASILRFQLLFERLVNFPRGLTLQRTGLLDACRIVKLPDILRKIQVPIGNPPRPGCRRSARSSSAFSSHMHPTLSRTYTETSGPSIAFGRSNSRAHLQGRESATQGGSLLMSSVSTKSLLVSGTGGAPQPSLGLQRPRLAAGEQMPFGSLANASSVVPRMPSVALLPVERRRRLGLPDVEALWYYHLQSVRKQFQLNDSSHGLGLLETWYVFESLALICFPFLPSKAKLLEAFLNPTAIKTHTHALSTSVLGGFEKAEALAAEKRAELSLRSQLAFAKDLEEALRKVEEEERRALSISKQGDSKRRPSKTAKELPLSQAFLERHYASEDERGYEHRYSSRSTTTETVAEVPVGQVTGEAPDCRLDSEAKMPQAPAQLIQGSHMPAASDHRDGRLTSREEASRSGAQKQSSRVISCGRRLTSLPPRLQRKLLSGEDLDEQGLESLACPFENGKKSKDGSGLMERNGSSRAPQTAEAPAWYEGLCAAWPHIGDYVCRHISAEERREAMERLVDYFQLRWDYHNYCVVLQEGSV